MNIKALCFLLAPCLFAQAPPHLRGPLLGQKRPGKVPELFAPGIVNQGLPVRDLVVSPDGKEIVWAIEFNGGPTTLVGVREEASGWTAPEVLPFARDSHRSFIEPCFSPDGQKLFFAGDYGTRPDGGRNVDLFVVAKSGKGWGTPVPLEAPINTETSEYFPSLTSDGTLYFCRDEMPRSRAHFLYRSRLVGGKYQTPERLPAQVNGEESQYNAFVAPDESFLIWSTVPSKGGVGRADYCIAFRRADDVWSEARVLGPPISSPASQEWSASLSPDGKCLFFLSARMRDGLVPPGTQWTFQGLQNHARQSGIGQPCIYWVDAAFIDALRKTAKFPS